MTTCKKQIQILLLITFSLLILIPCASSATTAQLTPKATTHREKQFENKDVSVWKTTIEPNQPLILHRHDTKRVLVALTDVDLTVVTNHGKSHQLVLKKDTAILLEADKPNQLHCDINKSHHRMQVMVIEFKK